MPTTTTLLGFIAAALALLLTPGPAVLYLVTRSLSQGTRAGLISVLGLSAGVFVHIGAAAVGISALVLASATAFTLVKGLGAVYLIYLGLRTMFSRGKETSEPGPVRASHRLFLDGVVVSVFNPKLAIFFLAFLPQFVDPSRGPVPRQIVILGLIYIALALMTDSTYALLASRLRRLAPTAGSERSWPRYLAGSVYLGLGVTAALTGRRG